MIAPRSIPACAGEPARPHRQSRPDPVYPRVCGGTPGNPRVRSPAAGLSPRVRGNRGANAFPAAAARSIPACAGEPSQASAPAGTAWVYPRVCGGTMGFRLSKPTRLGLSPRVRGNPHRYEFSGIRLRSIPACAGEPPPYIRRPVPPMVYPRVCGGTAFEIGEPHGRPGLSPRVRGNPQPAMWGRVGRGSIPACAGEPSSGESGHPARAVYPRVCGGTPRCKKANWTPERLSPRVRGNPPNQGPKVLSALSIPACAGEPNQRNAANPAPQVYPRVCGGTAASWRHSRTTGGLSPRVRGNRWRGWRR